MIFAFVMMVRKKDSFRAKPGNIKYLLIRSVGGVAGMVGNFYAIDRLDLSDASMLNKMSPFLPWCSLRSLLKKSAAQAGDCYCGGILRGTLHH